MRAQTAAREMRSRAPAYSTGPEIEARQHESTMQEDKNSPRSKKNASRNGTHRRDPAHTVDSSWTIRMFREGEPTGPAIMELTFPTMDKRVITLPVPAGEIRHPRRLLDLLS